MHKSNLTGGKHHKKGKKKKPINNIEQKLETANSTQVYAIAKKKLGGRRLEIECSDTKIRSAIIPGKLYKKIWINIGDIILCDLNIGGVDDICYITHKYNPKDANILKRQGLINFEIMDETPGYKFEDKSLEVQPQKFIPDINNLPLELEDNQIPDQIDQDDNLPSDEENSQEEEI